MKEPWLYLKKTFNKTKRFFDHKSSATSTKRHYNGIGQLVLLLSLTPFIFSLSLYDLHIASAVASKYQFPIDRFDGLSYEALLSHSFKKPSKPLVRISSKDRREVSKFARKSPEQICVLSKKQFTPFELIAKPHLFMRVKLDSVCKRYQRDLATYKKNLSKYNQKIKENRNEQNRLKKQADSFIVNAHLKPPAAIIEVLETSYGQFDYLRSELSLDDSTSKSFIIDNAEDMTNGVDPIENGTNESTGDELNELEANLDPPNFIQILLNKFISATSFEILTAIPWLMALLLIVPALIFSIKQKDWSMLIFGLAAPSYYYAYYIINSMASADALTVMQTIPSGFALIGFIYFLIRGSITAKVFMIFIGVLFLCSLMPLFVSMLSFIDLAHLDSDGYSVWKAQIPILIFIALSCIGRLLVKGACENFVLLKNIGLAKNLQSAAHAFLLWLPMALLCLPFFYLSKVYVPKNVTDQLHQATVLRFDHTHQQGFLDNALQSIAHISDDINFAWHLVVEERKAQLYASNEALQNVDFEQTLNKHYDEVIPQSLQFYETNSGAPLVGWLVDISSKETQKTIDKAYRTLRNDIRQNLSQLVAEKEHLLKEKAKEGKDAVIDELELINIEGQSIIQSQNSNAQTSVWWTYNYLSASHQLAMLFFLFICFKSYFYVFSRVIFNKDKGATVSLAREYYCNDNNTTSQIENTGIDYSIDCTKPCTYYVSRIYQCRGKPPKLTVPQMFRAPLARLFSSAYTMNKVQVKTEDKDITCTATKGVEFFEWDLKAGETVVFDFKNFVGMTEELQLSTLISPRLSSLLLGKMIYSRATGPGKLIVMAAGRAQVCNANHATGALPPERIIAMQTNTTLHVDSELDVVNVYLSSAYVTPISGNMIIDVDTQKGAKSGLIRFLRNFILPY